MPYIYLIFNIKIAKKLIAQHLLRICHDKNLRSELFKSGIIS